MRMFCGTGVAVVTPFTSDLEIDFPALKKILHHLISGGVDYVVALGTTGEASTLSEAEKNQVFDSFFSICKDRIPVVIGLGGNHTQGIIQQLSDLEKRYPLSGILSVSPYYNKPTQAGIYQHYAQIAQATELPILLYNVPGRTASNISAETTLSLAHSHDNIVGVKEASGDIEQVMQILKERPANFTCLSGDDALTLPLISLGGDGVISVIANAFPTAFSSLVARARAGDFDQARQHHFALLNAIKLIFQEGNPSGIKCLLAKLGLCESTVRLPLVSASLALEAAISENLAIIKGETTK